MSPIRILVTAGPTREPIDPVRFISNYSTGAMGYAIAEISAKRGHKTTLITGPANIRPPEKVKAIKITTAKQMFKAVKIYSKTADCIIMAAAVSDFRPALYSKKKLKRIMPLPSLKLTKNPDILYWLSRRKDKGILVGFCMETQKLIQNARKKKRLKKMDIIVANKIGKNKTAFGQGKTTVFIVGPGENAMRLKNTAKEKIAGILLDKIEKLWYKKSLGR